MLKETIGINGNQNQRQIRMITEEQIRAFSDHLREEERTEGTIEKYARDVRAFMTFAEMRNEEQNVAVETDNGLTYYDINGSEVKDGRFAASRFNYSTHRGITIID